MNVTFDLKKLASSLAKMNKLPKENRPVSYQDYLQSLSKIAGFSSYEAFAAGGGQSVSTVAAAAPLADAEYTSVWTSGHTITTACKLNLETMEITDIGIADPNNDVEGLYEEYVSYNGTKYQAVQESEFGNHEAASGRVFAISCLEDFEKAISPVADAMEKAKVFMLQGVPFCTGIDGDWVHEVQDVFRDGVDACSFAEELDQCTIWSPEATHEGRHREHYFSAYQLLFSKVKIIADGTFLFIPDGSGSIEVRLLS